MKKTPANTDDDDDEGESCLWRRTEAPRMVACSELTHISVRQETYTQRDDYRATLKEFPMN